MTRHLNSALFSTCTVIIAIHKPSSSPGSSNIHRAFHSKQKCHLLKKSYPDSSNPPSSHSPLYDNHLNRSAYIYPVSSEPLGIELTTNNPSDSSQRPWTICCLALGF